MKMFKDNLEFQIKKQIEEREVLPSRDLWKEIQSQTDNVSAKKTNVNWVLLAACFVLFLSLGGVLYFNENKATQVRVVKNDAKSDFEKHVVEKQSEKVDRQDIISRQNIELADNKITKEKVLLVQKDDKETSVQSSLPLIKENVSEAISQVSMVYAPKILAKTDSSKTKKKRKYVDPSTLLFSVENKDAIEKTKDGSNLATIDLHP